VKVSVSLPAADVEFLDEYARRRDCSRSGAVHQAIATLRQGELADAYQDAFAEWDAAGEEKAWEQTTLDGL
jgi:hypothetical protein